MGRSTSHEEKASGKGAALPKNKSQLLPNSVNGSGRRYATIKETAAYMRINERTVRLMIDDGRLRAYRFGPRIVRLNLDEIDDVMAGGGVAAAQE
jgi:excisionase family DNA binding protein